MSTKTSKLPISSHNIIIIAATFAAAIVTALLGDLLSTTMLLIISVGSVIFATLARRPSASDLLRINSAEYRDERDVRLAMNALAVVGIVALVIAVAGVVASSLYVSFVGRTGTAVTIQMIATAQFFVLSAAWGWANSVAIKRG